MMAVANKDMYVLAIRRLQTAATLLRHTDLALRRIARTLGYTDEFHLSRRFRARFGVPPSRYRD